MLCKNDGEFVAQAELGLIKLLPRLKPEDAGLLSSYQRECLYGIMQIGNISGKSELIAEALDALARIGDIDALPTVDILASCHVDSSACRRVKTAAEQCLQTLKESPRPGRPRRVATAGLLKRRLVPQILCCGPSWVKPDRQIRWFAR